MLDRFKKDSLEMRKIKNPYSVSMVTVMSEARMIAKNDGNREMTESDLIRQIKKTVTNINMTITLLEERGLNTSHQEGERFLLEGYLPKQMFDDEIRVFVKKILANEEKITPRSMGIVMQRLKAERDGLYDGKNAAKIIREVISECK